MVSTKDSTVLEDHITETLDFGTCGRVSANKKNISQIKHCFSLYLRDRFYTKYLFYVLKVVLPQIFFNICKRRIPKLDGLM